MLEDSLKELFEKIFKVQKVTFDAPVLKGDGSVGAAEQECIFIQIDISKNIIKDKREKAMVTGTLTMIAKNDKLHFGFFSKAIMQADPTLTKDLFFFDFEANTKRFRDIVQRDVSFTYFFDSQYDPNTGSIEGVTINVEEY